MYIVLLEQAIPGVRATAFAFYSDSEAYEFQSCLASRYPDLCTTCEPVGEATDVFENWSF